MGNGRRHGWGRAALVGLLLLTGAGCASQEPAPLFPEVEETRPFLLRQAILSARAKEILDQRERERQENVRRFKQKTLAAWEPVYARVRAHELREDAKRRPVP